MTIHRFKDKNSFISSFDDSNGDYYRTGILNEKGEDTGEDPFFAEFPQLLDIGIMGHCEHGLSGLCASCGVECYQNGGTQNEPNMLIDDFKKIIAQCEGRTFQVALGGRGDPELHEHFEDILYSCRYYGIAPNITTSGYALTDNHVKAISKYCGAAAVSWYKTSYTFRALEKLIDAGVTTNIHFVLGNNNIEEAIKLLSSNSILEGVSRIIFLLHKPVGGGSMNRVLSSYDKNLSEFFQLLSTPKIFDKIGFDSCLVPGIVANCPDIPVESFDACESGRFSAYIGPDLFMCPCSFDKTGYYTESLYEKSIADIWNGNKFMAFRSIFKNRCNECKHYKYCLGGCPIEPKIRLCGLCDNREVEV